MAIIGRNERVALVDLAFVKIPFFVVTEDNRRLFLSSYFMIMFVHVIRL